MRHPWLADTADPAGATLVLFPKRMNKAAALEREQKNKSALPAA